jgi:hypothetical protein
MAQSTAAAAAAATATTAIAEIEKQKLLIGDLSKSVDLLYSKILLLDSREVRRYFQALSISETEVNQYKAGIRTVRSGALYIIMLG